MAIAERPIIAVTIGDAAGIGPEIVVKALYSEQIYNICRPLVVGDRVIVQEAIELINKPMKLHRVRTPAEVYGQFGTIDLLDLQNIDRQWIYFGQACGACGKAAMEYIVKAAQLALDGKVKAIVNAPINKQATKQAGYEESGHLEFLADLTGSTEYATMLVVDFLRVVHLTTHYPLRNACDLVAKNRIIRRLKLINDSFRQWGIESPRIGVAALNPHAGEGGLFGTEEIKEIIPAVEKAQSIGIDARGPLPADSIFGRAINRELDVVLAMYHDQGHIPIKVHGFEKSVSVALGLPFVRTSVDHGTAFDIAGKGIATSQSLEEAIRMAVELGERRRFPRIKFYKS